MRGNVFNIQRYSIHDGPGIRTTVFLKGCNMRCFWCHNPESIDPRPQIQFFPQKCIGCGKCYGMCPELAILSDAGRRVYLNDKCVRCGKCAENCYAEALVLTGKTMKADEIIAEIGKDRHFYQSSGGGVTFSGGEPLLQPDFLRELLIESKKQGYHTVVDTAGNVPWKIIEDMIPFVNLWLYDIKLYNSERHKSATGSDNALILENLGKLASRTKAAVRIPVIPGVNGSVEETGDIAGFLSGLAEIQYIELLPLNHLSEGKYGSLNLDYKIRDYVPPSRAELDILYEIFESKGLRIKK